MLYDIGQDIGYRFISNKYHISERQVYKIKKNFEKMKMDVLAGSQLKMKRKRQLTYTVIDNEVKLLLVWLRADRIPAILSVLKENALMVSEKHGAGGITASNGCIHKDADFFGAR